MWQLRGSGAFPPNAIALSEIFSGENRVALIAVSSSISPQSWKRAGIVQQVFAELSPTGQELILEPRNSTIRLNQSNLILLPETNLGSFRLRFRPVPWLLSYSIAFYGT